MRIILQPAGSLLSQRNYRKTVGKSVELSRIADHLDPMILAQLQESRLNGKTAVWGITAGVNGQKQRKWNRINRGDMALFCGQGHVYTSAVVTTKTHNVRLAAELWDYDERGQTWEYVYFLDDVRPMDIPYRTLNLIVGYSAAAV